MARKLKTFQTSMGFFDLAIAAPSMKAALQAWGSKTNLFHMKMAQETNEAAVVAATMAKPGIVLKRPVGTTGAFKIEAKLPSRLPAEKVSTTKRPAPAKRPRSTGDAKSEKAAAAAHERRERKREEADRKEDAARKKKDAAVARVKGEIENAEREHQDLAAALDAKRDTIDEQASAEESRWQEEKHRLEGKLRRAEQ